MTHPACARRRDNSAIVATSPATTAGVDIIFEAEFMTPSDSAAEPATPMGIAEDHAALHALARLVALGVDPDEVFVAVADQAAEVLGADIAAIDRFDPDDMVTLVAVRGAAGDVPAIGSRTPTATTGNAARVRATGRPARIDEYTEAYSSIGYRSGFRAAVSVPITVGGGLWGVMTVASKGEVGRFPPGTEERLAAFTDLAVLAIANAKTRQDLAMVAEEQAALRWIATLVARGAQPEAVSSAVAEELGRLFGADAAYVMRDERDGTVTAVGGWSREGLGLPIAVGRRIPTAATGIAGRVLRTGISARAESFDASPGSLAALLRDADIAVAVASPLRVQDHTCGLVVMASRAADAFPADVERRLEAFADLVAIAVVNARARAEVAASRARVVASGDEARRQIGRDLHDGAQQRLVSLALDLRVAQDLVSPGCDELAEQLDSIVTQLNGAMEELRHFVRGIHPPALEYGGLEAALRALARRSPIPVELTVDVHDRLPKSLAANAYFIVAEALTNAAKHARASASQVEVRADDGVLRLAVSDDGVGGADPAGGSGLLGLRDRVEAVAGKMSVRSPRGEGTVLLVQMPLSAERATEAGGQPQS
jgi:signal transduction histidine kinase